MASATPSPLASSEEKTYGWKLSRLLIDGGTPVLRRHFDQLCPPKTLKKSLDSHYTILNELSNSSQRDILCPPSGASPADSSNFDISLLFFLLTNICGLSPPRLGWHRKPHQKDRSREANLARIKFYRNKVYGHIVETGIDARTFSALWKEISAVLRSLGLPQADIDRLMVERCGEEDYIALLRKWKISDEAIKSQLERLGHALNKTQRTLDGVRQIQQEDHETIQGNARKLEEVHQLQKEKSADSVNQENRAKLEDIHHTQLDGNRILHESQATLGEVRDDIKDLKGERESLKGEEVPDRKSVV